MRRASPDETLHLILVRTGAVFALGFEESPWHVHPDDIADLYYNGQASDAEDMLHRFVADIVDDRLVIEVEFSGGSLVNAMVCRSMTLPCQSLAQVSCSDGIGAGVRSPESRSCDLALLKRVEAPVRTAHPKRFSPGLQQSAVTFCMPRSCPASARGTNASGGTHATRRGATWGARRQGGASGWRDVRRSGPSCSRPRCCGGQRLHQRRLAALAWSRQQDHLGGEILADGALGAPVDHLDNFRVHSEIVQRQPGPFSRRDTPELCRQVPRWRGTAVPAGSRLSLPARAPSLSYASGNRRSTRSAGGSVSPR